jgi:hypothetical protein
MIFAKNYHQPHIFCLIDLANSRLLTISIWLSICSQLDYFLEKLSLSLIPNYQYLFVLPFFIFWLP